MSLPVLKVLAALGVLIVGGAGALLPWALQARASHERLIAWGETFAAGVLGGAGLVHLLSAGVGEFALVLPGASYPWSYVIAGISFLLVMAIEQVLVSDNHERIEGIRAHPVDGCEDPSASTGRRTSGTLPFVLLLVLSIHSIIVGTTLGAQKSLVKALIVLIAVLAHKGTAGFALGVSYKRASFSLRGALPELAFFATMTPLGILIGTGVSALVSSTGAQWFEAIFDSLGAGTFLYIATLEILDHAFDKPEDHAQKWGATVLGFALMTVIAIWI